MENLQPKLRFPEFREDWKLFKINDVGLVITGTTPSTSVKEYYNGSNLFLSPADIDDNRFVYNTKTTLSDLGFSKTRKLKPNSIAFVCIGSTIGKIAQVKKEFSTNQQINSIEFKNDFNEDFSYYTLLKESSKIKLMAGVQTVPQINKTEFSKIKISYPTLQEQTKIANFLGAVDKQLDVLNQKKEKLNLYKKGVMQQLFSQQLRFKNDNGNDFPDWQEKTLGEVAKINKGQQLNKEHFIEGGNYKVLNGGISHSGFTDTFNRKGSVITISEGGNSCGFTNYITEDFWLGGHCYALDDLASNINDIYLYQYLKFIEPKTMRLRVGSGLPNIQKKDLSKLIITIPSIEEQTKIANFLSVIDTQIEAVENHITKTETYKKGLLQQMFV